jgi:hypothetical protein
VGRRPRIWIAGGLVTGLLAGGVAVASALADGVEADAGGAPITLAYVATRGAECEVQITPIVRTPDPAAWWIARRFIGTADLQALHPVSDPGAPGEVEAVIDALSLATEEEIVRLRGWFVDVTLESVYACSVAVTFEDGLIGPPILGDDFGREPTLLAGRAPDVIGFFQASTGQICEVQLKVDADEASGATEADGALQAREYLASIDFTTVDYSAALREMPALWPDDHDQGELEAFALIRALTRQAHRAVDTSLATAVPMGVSGWSQCDPPSPVEQ